MITAVAIIRIVEKKPGKPGFIKFSIPA